MHPNHKQAKDSQSTKLKSMTVGYAYGGHIATPEVEGQFRKFPNEARQYLTRPQYGEPNAIPMSPSEEDRAVKEMNDVRKKFSVPEGTAYKRRGGRI